MEIVLSKYEKLVTNVKQCIGIGEQKIAAFVAKEKVKIAWEIGGLIHGYLKNKNKFGSETVFLKKLAEDTEINENVLYKMHNFYKSYPEMPTDNSLTWSHYRVLGEIKDTEKRKYLEDLTVKNAWDVVTLEREARNDGEAIGGRESNGEAIGERETKKVSFNRGQLFAYKLIISDNKKFIDCGFDIFKDIETDLDANGEIVVSEKNAGNYSLKNIKIEPKKLHTYKASIEKVVDGDTLNVILDLGFGIFNKQILRLRGIDAPDVKTDEGRKSQKALEEILQGVEFVVIKTNKTDIYGRYVADVFFCKTESDTQVVADTGEYLNQILLDRGLAVRFM